MDFIAFSVYVFYALSLLLTISISIPDLEFSFEVNPVNDCPINKEAWELASARLKCNRTHGYHCVPNKQFTSLIEFCYPKGYKYPFEKGNCLELAGNGILNQVSCKTFSSGCPDRFFFSNELYKFPKCLSINANENCFEADIPCICSRYTDVRTSTNKATDSQDEESSKYFNTTIGFAICLSFLFLTLIIVVILKIIKFLKQKSIWFRKGHKLEKNALNTDEEAELIVIKDEGNPSLRRLHDLIVQGTKQGFHHIICDFNKDALEQWNLRGLNCLHLAAKGGNIQIFKKILRCGVSIDAQAIDGRNVLHIAAHHGNYAICEYLLQKHKNLYTRTDRYAMNPAHWAALAGEKSILELFMKYECDLTELTNPYKENIVLFACMGKSLAVCKFVGSNKNISHLLHAKNREGWSSIQYAAKSGNLEVFKYLVDEGVDIENKSQKTGKNCLHTACEKGHAEICEFILKKNPELFKELDKNMQHIGHFAAKSGDTKILKLLKDHTLVDKSFLHKATIDNINILHIACRHARFEMCLYIVDEFPFMIHEITEKGWNAALFITERAGAENERIQILESLTKMSTPLNVYHVSRSGKTILFNACVNRSPKLVQYLLENFPDLPEIEKSMDPIESANSDEIKTIFKTYYQKNYKC